ncbi:MAG TPA: DUF2239 family protein [Holophagaceae bacterium]
MDAISTTLSTAFVGSRRLATGPLGEVALAVKAHLDGGQAGSVLVFDDETGQVIDLDLRGTPDEVIARLSPPAVPSPELPRGRGRPKLGVVAREVTLLPRHWEWLNAQPGGASVALRKLVEEARKSGAASDGVRQAQERAYQFMAAMVGDAPGFEESLRALYQANAEAFDVHTRSWPADVREHALALAQPVLATELLKGQGPG